MFHVRISKSADIQIKQYIDLYTSYFQELFTDTGIWSEEVIQRNYEISGEMLFRSIYALIGQKLSQEILPYSFTQHGDRSVLLSLGNRRIAIEYIEDQSIRTIKNITIWYKH